ncbi:helix-turn-helix transcriptional regulator [Carnobacterium maltaromaticum]|uniref:helix-turn-helix transcriptional regulator n=1 Tax=Carnobacterium maltaromaticum TaxID=2751 RepID=UPI0039BE1822
MFAENLKYLREKHNMEQLELAQKLGRKSSSSISEWEKGKYTPKIGVLNDIAKLFKVDIDDLMNIDLSLHTSKDNIISIYNQLEKSRQEKVYSYAEEQLEEQHTKNKKFSSLEEYRKKVPDAIDTLAAHSADRTRKYTDEEIENIKDILDSMIEEHKNNK